MACTAATVTYHQLWRQSGVICAHMQQHRIDDDAADGCKQRTVVVMSTRGVNYTCSMLATWRLGLIFVPLSDKSPQLDLAHYVDDARPVMCVVDDACGAAAAAVRTLALERRIPVVNVTDVAANDDIGNDDDDDDDEEAVAVAVDDNDNAELDRGAMIIFTSGTTGKPKGVLHTHRSVAAQVLSLRQAWGWTSGDRVLNVLPMHHVHGIVNVLACALGTGATCEFHGGGADSGSIVRRLVDTSRPPITLFMAVPTIYTRIIAWLEQQQQQQQQHDGAMLLHKAMSRVRLMVSGSAALPTPVFHRWRELTGHVLLERYGMTEFGMALSNPLAPESQRLPGYVGQPLPGIECKVAGGEGGGELFVRGPQMFREYWGRPSTTADSFDADGWFATGDVVEVVVIDGVHTYKILGRSSVDIIKSGGYKLSALEIEAVLLDHGLVSEVAVLGLPDDVYGERVAALIVVTTDDDDGGGGDGGGDAPLLTLDALREWGSERLPRYKLPSVLKTVPIIPRNAMGKVNKKSLRHMFVDE